ncbi:MFS transporter [Pseudalkalibacillus caeni]|uniref:MFS transporter n=1 Tax=Exobacillus caeni TaxID=2574798 RepID=A0A5R9F7K3_9BACL|nr:MFS transporter [Pseudalkalibacillus caeni]TLS36823.1 MFS transporter [Pseudalkalibacillus caeni]
MRIFIFSQSIALISSSIVFPYYLLFIKNVGSSFAQFGLAYGLFTLTSALVHRWIGKTSDKVGSKVFLIIHAWGMAVAFITLPLVSSLLQVYMLQVFLGVLGAMQKTCEKSMLTEFTAGSKQGELIGNYHFWTTMCSALAVMGSGFLIDYLTIHAIFYVGSIFFLISGLMMFKVQQDSTKSLNN